MKTPPTLTDSKPPRLFQTIISGFNLVANHIYLILPPIIVDLILWLGPKIKLQTLLTPQIQQMSDLMTQLDKTVDLKNALTSTKDVWTQFLGQFNLNILARTIPVGVPSLIAREITSDSPIGNIYQYQAPSIGITLLISLILIIVGFFIGTLYFNSLARFTANPIEKMDFKKLMQQFGQSVVMALILIVMVFFVAFPILMLLSMVIIASGQLADIILMLAFILLLWMAIPLVFAPHGVYVINQKAFPSMLLSIRMVRFFLPGASMYIITSALLSECLNLIWTIPDPSSWLTAVGIFGHAFIVTALIAASFIYYREGLRWMQDNLQRMSAPMSKSENGGPFGTTRQ